MKRKRWSKEKTGCQHEKEAAVKGKDLLLWEAAVKGKDLRLGGPWGPLIKYYSAPGCGGLRGLQQRGEGGRMGPPSRESDMEREAERMCLRDTSVKPKKPYFAASRPRCKCSRPERSSKNLQHELHQLQLNQSPAQASGPAVWCEGKE